MNTLTVVPGTVVLNILYDGPLIMILSIKIKK